MSRSGKPSKALRAKAFRAKAPSSKRSRAAASSGYKPEPTDRDLLHIIFDYIPRITKEKDLDKLLVMFADLGRDLITSDRCTVWLIDEKAGTLWSKVAHGVDRIVIPKSTG
ncbi:MAG TPA: hypothetical protein VMX75_04515, partial [Spirochaetia bacterium]|nr:hypothetical protein [Spirochaetia bacterium]